MNRSPVLLVSAVLSLSACQQPTPEPEVTPDPLALSAAPVFQDVVEPLHDVGPATIGGAAIESAVAAQDSPRGEEGAALAGVATADIVLRHGESLFGLAETCGVHAEDLAELNGIDVTTGLVAGQSLRVPVHLVSLDQVEAARDAAFERRLERYLRGRGGLAGVGTHRVHTGETAWSIARDSHGLPTWVLAAYNPDVDLDRLRIGDSLQVPLLADTVAELSGEDPAPRIEPEPSAAGLVPTVPE